MSLKTKQLVFSFIMALAVQLSSGNEFERFKSTNGHTCHSSCGIGKDNKFWCSQSAMGPGMHCSPEVSTTYAGESCHTECERFRDFYFCYLDAEHTKWNYCGPTESSGEEQDDLEVSSTYNWNDRFRSTNGYTCYSECSLGKEGKCWCRSDTAPKMHCSPGPRQTYKADTCTTDCMKYLDYYFCYTDHSNSSWDYCGPTEPEPILPHVVLTPEEIEAGGVLRSDIEELIRLEGNTISALETLKERILNAHKDYSISRTVGSSVSAVGGVASIAGVALAPFTGGGSLALTAAGALTAGGAAATILGGGTTLTTDIVATLKTNEWAEDLLNALAPRERQLKTIGLKIINHPTFLEYRQLGFSGTFYLAANGPLAINLGKMIKYVGITARQYGLHKFPTVYLAVSKLAAGKLPAQFLTKTGKIVSKALAHMAIQSGVKVGATSLRLLSTAAGIAGIGLDIFTVVDTWTSDPNQATQIDEIISNLRESMEKLRELRDEL